MAAMQNFCTRCGNPRSAQASTCAHCGNQYGPVRTETERVEVAGPEPERPEENWLAAPPTVYVEPPAYAGPPALADPAIPVYEEPEPTTWDYGVPRGPAPGDLGAGGLTTQSLSGLGYYEEPQRLPADAGDAFWGRFQGSPDAQPGLTAQPYPQAPYPQPAQYPQPVPQAQPAPRQPASHRLVAAQPAPRGGTQPPSRWSLSGRPSGTLIAAAALLVLACGGGAYAAVTALTGHSGKAGGNQAAAGVPSSPAAQNSSIPATSPAATPPASTPASTTPVTTSPPASTPPSTTPPPTTPPPTTPPAAPGTTTVAVAGPAQSNPAEPQVLSWVEGYFTAINAHDYNAYVSLLGSQLAANVTPTSFTNGFGSTRDSAATLTGISDEGSGYEAATVSFTSHQNPSQSVNRQDSCDLWTITLYLEPDGSGYLQVPSPSGYSSSHQAC
jgi:hypothetical protein